MKWIFAAFFALFLSACTTPYQEMGATGGVKAEAIGYDRYRVSSLINAYTSPPLVVDYMMLKAAETAIANGASHFIVESVSDNTTVNTYATPGVVNCWGYGCVATPSTIQQSVIPAGHIIIRLVRGSPPSNATSAKEIVDTIGSRVSRGG
ncbi:hypothetical protein [Mesorhizobium sp. CAU 1741]|uniref:CC0125/CC1285 family lipoprotein n=1 Tax=Mesorhizobium sp. CAU 1741 TaxID=3140366 RepID=UPI00325AEBEA